MIENIVNKALITLLMTGMMSSVAATSYRLDFSGETISTGFSFSGYLILDFDVVDSLPSLTGGNYFSIVTDLSLQIAGVTYGLLSNGINLAQVIDNHPANGDVFSISTQVQLSDASFNTFWINFQSTSGSLFSGDALPDSLELSDYDPFFDNGNSTTGVLLPLIDGVTSGQMSPLTSVEFRQVPLPGGLLLFVSAMAIVSTYRK